MKRVLVPKCFVISEIGVPGSPERHRADKYKDIIDRALEIVSSRIGRSIVAERFDEAHSDTIFERVVEHILKYELVVAVLGNHNRNVHLELGIALAAGRDVALLVQDVKHDLPSDLSNYIAISCDLDRPEPAIVELANRFEKSIGSGEPQRAFGRYGAMGKPNNGVTYLNRFKNLSFEEWSRFLWSAQRSITIATTSLKYLVEETRRSFLSRRGLLPKSDPYYQGSGQLNLLELLIYRAGMEGIKVRLMVMSDTNPYLNTLVHDRNAFDATNAEIKKNVSQIANYLSRAQQSEREEFLKERYPGYTFPTRSDGEFKFVLMERGALYRRVMATERAAIVTPYFLLEPTNSELPAFFVEKTDVYETEDAKMPPMENRYYEKIIEDLDELERCSAAVNVTNRVVLTPEACRRILSS